MKIACRKLLGIAMVLALVLATKGLAVSGETATPGSTSLSADQGNHSMHNMPGHMTTQEQQFYQALEKEKASSAKVSEEVEYQPAGVVLLEDLENRLDQEIEK